MKWAAVSISPAQAFALATGGLRWRDRRYGHPFLVMSILATVFYYVASWPVGWATWPLAIRWV